MKDKLKKYSGISLALGGVFTFLINAGLTPFMQIEDSGVDVAVSNIFLWRQSLSALTAIFLFIGIVGVYERQINKAGRFGVFSFLIAFIGSAMLLAQECNQIFFVRDLAIRAPETMLALDAGKEFALPEIGSIIVFSFFALGWILFSISTILAKVYRKKGPILIIAGFFATPILTAILPDFLGMTLGNAILSAGWVLMGLERFRSV